MAGVKTPRVVVVGGGPAGATLAITLARRGLKPIVLEALRGPESKIGECLPPGANALLERLKLKDRFPYEGHLPSHGNRSVWGSPVPVERDFLFGTHGHGWHLDRRRFEEDLANLARDEGVDWQYGCRLVGCSKQNGKWMLSVKTLLGDKNFEADFVADATGRPARVARQLGAKQVRYDRLVGAAVLMKAARDKPIKGTFTLVEAVATGWWYSAQLPDGALMVIYMSDSDLMDRAVIRQKNGWAALLEETNQTWQRVREGSYLPQTEPHILSANSARMDLITGERWLAVGDAAVCYDPLSSYGISSAMGCGLHATDAVIESLEGRPNALLTYRTIIDRAYAQYMAMHCEHYALERRWIAEPFWKRRHSSSFGKQPVQGESELNIETSTGS
jgi:flavin-dependent dehydrogenase